MVLAVFLFGEIKKLVEIVVIGIFVVQTWYGGTCRPCDVKRSDIIFVTNFSFAICMETSHGIGNLFAFLILDLEV